MALVLTFEAPDEVLSCVRALQSQVVAPAEILVIDNHGRISPDADVLATAGQIPLRLRRLAANSGPAGGHADGLRQFLSSERTYAWVMDDDVRPEPTCLQQMLVVMHDHLDAAVVGPAIVDATTGERFDGWGWCGALIPRRAVEQAGVPDSRLFWGLEDQEYLRDRLPLAGYPPVRCDDGVVRVHRRPSSTERPGWKYYYESRNRMYRYLYDRPHIPRPVRLKSLCYATIQECSTIWRRERDRVRKLGYVALGIVDGLLKRLGKRIEPRRADRPWKPEP
jgi:GT2 family glycosyltransferase